jgi:hypothetical protein
MAENRKGKLVSATPVFVNGQHKTWHDDKNNATNYEFTLVWDNGDVGTGNARSSQGSYKIGNEYSYMKNVRVWKDQQYTSFYSLKDLDYDKNKAGGSGGGFRKGMSDEDKKRILNKVSLESTNNIMVKIDEDYNAVFLKLRNWLYLKVFSHGENFYHMQDIVKLAAQYYREAAIKSCSSDQIIVLSEALIKTVNNISWTDPNTQTPEGSSQRSSNQQPPQNYQQDQPPMGNPNTEEKPPWAV